jgi:hypothetical protein
LGDIVKEIRKEYRVANRHRSALKEEEALAAYIANSYFTLDALDALERGARKAVGDRSEQRTDHAASVSD